MTRVTVTRSINVFLILVLILTMALSAADSSAAEEPKRGGVLKILSASGDATYLGYPPKSRKLLDYQYVSPCIETLIRFDKDLSPAPNLATDWKIASDRKSITFTLRKGVKFHDGTNFNAEAVKFNLELQMEAKRGEIGAISSIDIVDDNTIRLNLKNFDSLLIPLLGTNVGLIASPAILKRGETEANRNPVGTGPFKFKSWDRDSAIKFTKFDGYWQSGKPYLDGLEWVMVKDPMTALAMFKSGAGHVYNELPAKQFIDLRETGQYNLATAPSAYYWVAPDSRNEKSPFADIRVRRAAAHAVDMKHIIDNVTFGLYRYLPQSAPPEDVAYNSDIVGYDFNPAKAKQLLKDAGYPNGFKTKMFSIPLPMSLSISLAIKPYLDAVGIDTEVVQIEWGAWTQMANTPAGWDGLLTYAAGTIVPDHLRVYLVGFSGRDTWLQSVNYPADLREAIGAALETADEEAKKALLKRINQLVIDKHCLGLFFYDKPSLGVISKNVRDLGLYQPTSYRLNPADAWLSK